MCLELVLAGERLQGALADPVKALHTSKDEDAAESLPPSTTANAPRVAALVARAIRARELSMLDVWFASLGPVASALFEAAVRGAIRRTPPPPPGTKKKEPKLIEGYELVKPLGEGGVGTVWLVRKPGADRLFVLKIPKADALASANDVERVGLLDERGEDARLRERERSLQLQAGPIPLMRNPGRDVGLRANHGKLLDSRGDGKERASQRPVWHRKTRAKTADRKGSGDSGESQLVGHENALTMLGSRTGIVATTTSGR
jgi:hypothetical protein